MSTNHKLPTSTVTPRNFSEAKAEFDESHAMASTADCIVPVNGKVRQGIRAVKGPRVEASMVIGTGRKTDEGEEGEQDEIHLPGLRTERMGQAGRAVNLRRVLRGQRRRNLSHAGRAEPRECAEAAQPTPRRPRCFVKREISQRCGGELGLQ